PVLDQQHENVWTDWLAGEGIQPHQTRRHCCTYRYPASTGDDLDHYCLSTTPAATRQLGYLSTLGFATFGRNHNRCFMVCSVGPKASNIHFAITKCYCLLVGITSSICRTTPTNCCSKKRLVGVYRRGWNRKNIGPSCHQPG